MTIVIYPLIISFSLYIMILIWFIYGNYIKISSQISKGNPPVSIIIAIRNGEQSLPNLMFDLSMQNYSGKMEFILIDDESVDATKELIIKKSNQDKRFIYVSSSIRAKKLRHKKGALDVGIKKASNDDYFQFQRKGYFKLDNCDNNNMVFNRTVTLRDTWKNNN